MKITIENEGKRVEIEKNVCWKSDMLVMLSMAGETFANLVALERPMKDKEESHAGN